MRLLLARDERTIASSFEARAKPISSREKLSQHLSGNTCTHDSIQKASLVLSSFQGHGVL